MSNLIRFECVRTDAGWHGRVVAGNGEIVWTTEVLVHRDGVLAAADLLSALINQAGRNPGPHNIVDVDEREGETSGDRS